MQRIRLEVTRSIVAKAAEQGLRKNFDVAPHGPVLDVIEIVLYPVS